MSHGQMISVLIAAAGVALLVLVLAQEAPSRVAFEAVESANERVVVHEVVAGRTQIACDVQGRSIARSDVQEPLALQIDAKGAQHRGKIPAADGNTAPTCRANPPNTR